jgi:hypothetical protein
MSKPFSHWTERNSINDRRALFANQSHSIPDNLVALLGHIHAWNYSAENAARLTTFSCCSTARQNAVPWDAVRAGPVPKSRAWLAGYLLSARMLAKAER